MEMFFITSQACLKKNQNGPRPSEHPPVRGKNVCCFIPARRLDNARHDKLHGWIETDESNHTG